MKTKRNEFKSLALYHYQACPFCAITRQAIAANPHAVELRNIQHDSKHRSDLIKGGGKSQVPCLRIEQKDGTEQWLYESSDIIRYLARAKAVAA